MIIKEQKFNVEVAQDLTKEWYGQNWPVVYILNDRKEAYIGETTSITTRMRQHLKSEDKNKLTTINIISHDEFNKSAVLDVESKLIEYMSADNTYKIINSNSGMRDHNYFEKEKYEKLFRNIWEELRKKKIVKQHLDVLVNSELFKYTPYKRLTDEQFSVAYDIVLDILIMVQTGQTSVTIVNGEAGTGKTVLAMYIMKLFADKKVLEFLSEENESVLEQFKQAQEKLQNFKVALVVPMTSLRNTLRKVARSIEGLSAKMILGPNDVVKDEYDLLIVDESHRLYRRVGLTGFGAFDNVNKKLEFDKEATQLEWILASSKHQIFFYDRLQSIRPSDVREEDFMKLMSKNNFGQYNIISQLRSQGGNDYLKYIKELFSETPPKNKLSFENYDFKLYDNIVDVKNVIESHNEEVGLSRLIAGYAWEWKTKKLTYDEAVSKGVYDIIIQDQKFIWNTTNSGWAIDENTVKEMGSIHTTQGYDLNYAGVIIGNDIYYDKKSERIEINPDNYFDKKGKQSIKNYEELRNYIINIYIVLLSRAIKGTYLYICDENLKDYFKNYIY